MFLLQMARQNQSIKANCHLNVNQKSVENENQPQGDKMDSITGRNCGFKLVAQTVCNIQVWKYIYILTVYAFTVSVSIQN